MHQEMPLLFLGFNEPRDLFLPIFLTLSHSNSKIFIQMARLRIEQTQSLQMQQELRQILRMGKPTCWKCLRRSFINSSPK